MVLYRQQAFHEEQLRLRHLLESTYNKDRTDRNLRGSSTFRNPTLEGGIPDFMDGILDFICGILDFMEDLKHFNMVHRQSRLAESSHSMPDILPIFF